MLYWFREVHLLVCSGTARQLRIHDNRLVGTHEREATRSPEPSHHWEVEHSTFTDEYGFRSFRMVESTAQLEMTV
jgi:hypothetical protein